MHAVDNTQQLFLAIIYLKKFVLVVVVALPSYMLKVPNYTSLTGDVLIAISPDQTMGKELFFN